MKAPRGNLPAILTQRAAKEAKRIQFCYLCGKKLLRDHRNDDHVPPKALFSKDDRAKGPVLKLWTHPECNARCSAEDERTAQLLSTVLWNDGIDPQRSHLKLIRNRVDQHGNKLDGVSGANLDWSIVRWIRGFHAALYGEFAPSHLHYAPSLPFAMGKLTEDRTVLRDPQPVHEELVRTLVINRLSHTTDRIVLYGGKLEYECCWSHYDNGSDMCIWALRIYDWEKLGLPPVGPGRGCVGCYDCRGRRPLLASDPTEIIYAPKMINVLDPFDKLNRLRT